MWVPRGLIRSAGSLIYAIVNPMKLCRKYRLMPPLRPADVITAELALHNFCFSFSLSSRYSSSSPYRIPEKRVLVSAVYLVPRCAARTLSFFHLGTQIRARSKFPITLLLSLSILHLFSPAVSRRANPFTV